MSCDILVKLLSSYIIIFMTEFTNVPSETEEVKAMIIAMEKKALV